jgi:acetyl esterase/lipase
MKSRFGRVSSLTGALVLMVSVIAAAQESTWTIGPRILPPSGGVSEEFRESLIQTPAPNVESWQARIAKTDEEWRALVDQMDAPATDAAIALALAMSVAVEEGTVAGVKVHYVTPAKIAPEHSEHLFVYVHGGAWILNGGIAGTTEAVAIAARLGIPAVSIDYRMPPTYPAPAATDDVMSVWKALLKKHSPGKMIMGGSSAGGNITLSAVQRFKDSGLPLPAALYAGTPAAELDMNGDSRFLNEGVDRLLVSWKHLPHDAAAMYAGKYDLKHPHVSPIYGDFSDFPPSYLITPAE